jgi:predicted enzyme related to lactoylglutathione lyase
MSTDGDLDYIEFPAADIVASKAFYGTVFGWTFTDYGPDYTAFVANGRDGGFNPGRKPITGTGPLIVLYATDLDATEAKVVAAGASILSREEFPGGRRFSFRDPNGNELAVWTKR